MAAMTTERPPTSGGDAASPHGNDQARTPISLPVRMAFAGWVAASVYLLLTELTSPLQDGLRIFLFGVFVLGLVVIAGVAVAKRRTSGR